MFKSTLIILLILAGMAGKGQTVRPCGGLLDSILSHDTLYRMEKDTPRIMSAGMYAIGRNKGAYLPSRIVPRDTAYEPKNFTFTEGGAYFLGMYDAPPADSATLFQLKDMEGSQLWHMVFMPDPSADTIHPGYISLTDQWIENAVLDKFRLHPYTYAETVPPLGYDLYGDHSLAGIVQTSFPPDTLTPVWLLVVDTAHAISALVYFNNAKPPDDLGIWNMTAFMIPAFRRTLYDAQHWITGHEYLDDKKRPLPVTLVVWGEMERRAGR